jgi:hypothetical protein
MRPTKTGCLHPGILDGVPGFFRFKHPLSVQYSGCFMGQDRTLDQNLTTNDTFDNIGF